MFLGEKRSSQKRFRAPVLTLSSKTICSTSKSTTSRRERRRTLSVGPSAPGSTRFESFSVKPRRIRCVQSERGRHIHVHAHDVRRDRGRSFLSFRSRGDACIGIRLLVMIVSCKMVLMAGGPVLELETQERMMYEVANVFKFKIHNQSAPSRT